MNSAPLPASRLWRSPTAQAAMAALLLAGAGGAALANSPHNPQGAGTAAGTPAAGTSGATAHAAAALTGALTGTLSPAQLRQQLAAMPGGDAQRGQALYAQQFCASCHGKAGAAPSVNWPSVAGQRVAYGYKLLQDYQQGRHADTQAAALMRDAVWGLTPQQMADLAAYMARLSGASGAPGAPAVLIAVAHATPGAAQAVVSPADVQQLVRHGDRSRLLTACASCHGARGEGSHQAQPALAGQNPAYLVRTLLAYHGGARQNDPARGMRGFAAQLTRGEIDALAAYYAALPPARR